MFDWNIIRRNDEGKVVLLYRHQRVLDEGIIVPGMKVLDLGGWGVFSTRLLEEGIECTILDNFSEDQYYPDRVRSLPHIEGDILDEQLISRLLCAPYDVVTCFEMLEHCKDRRQAICNVYALLKTGGSFVGTVPIPGVVHSFSDLSVSFLNSEELHRLLSSMGFIDIFIEPTGSITNDEASCSLYFIARK
jgi:SAM-dependent methyltransferase